MASTQSHKRKSNWEPTEDDPAAKKPRLEELSRRNLDHVASLEVQKVPPISHDCKEPVELHDNFVSAWLQSITPEAEAMVKPDTSTIDSSTDTSKSGKSQKPEYGEALENFGIYVNMPPYVIPTGLRARAQAIIDKPRDISELPSEDELYYEILGLKTACAPENAVQAVWLSEILPTKELSGHLGLQSTSDQLWCRAPVIPRLHNRLLSGVSLSKPKPDFALGFSRSAFTPDQYEVIKELLDEHEVASYSRPDTNNLIFPFLAMEWKTLAKPGLTYSAAWQNANTCAIMLYCFDRLRERGLNGSSKVNHHQQFRFSLVLNQESASIYLHWSSEVSATQTSWFSQKLLGAHLDKAGLTVIRRAVLNIIDHAESVLLPEIQMHLDEIIRFGHKRKADSEDVPRSAKPKIQASSLNDK